MLICSPTVSREAIPPADSETFYQRALRGGNFPRPDSAEVIGYHLLGLRTLEPANHFDGGNKFGIPGCIAQRVRRLRCRDKAACQKVLGVDEEARTLELTYDDGSIAVKGDQLTSVPILR